MGIVNTPYKSKTQRKLMKNILFIAFISLFFLPIFASAQSSQLLPKLFIESLAKYIESSQLPWLMELFRKRAVTEEELDNLVERLSDGELGFNLEDYGVPSIHDVIPHGYNEYDSLGKQFPKNVYSHLKKIISELLGHDVFELLNSNWSHNFDLMNHQDQKFMSLFLVYKLVESLDNVSHHSYMDWDKTPYFQISHKSNLFPFINYRRKKELENLISTNFSDLLEIKKQAISFLMLLFRSDIVLFENLDFLCLILEKQFPYYLKSLNQLEKLFFVALIQRELGKIVIKEEAKEDLNKQISISFLGVLRKKYLAAKSNKNFAKDLTEKKSFIRRGRISDFDFLFFLMDKYKKLIQNKETDVLHEEPELFLKQLSYIRNHDINRPVTTLGSFQEVSDSEEILLDFIAKTFIELINSTDIIQNQSLMKEFYSKLVETGIFQNRRSAQYFKTEFINNMFYYSPICRDALSYNNFLKQDYYAYKTKRNKIAFLTYLRHFKNAFKKQMQINNDNHIDPAKKSIRYLKRIKSEDLDQSMLLKHDFSITQFGDEKDNENYQIYIYKVMKEVSVWIQETDLMMPYNKVLRDRVFERLNQIIIENKKQSFYGTMCLKIIYSELEKLFRINPQLIYLFSVINTDGRGINLQIYAEFYSYFLVKTYPNIKIRGRYRPVKSSGKTIIPLKLDRPYDTQIIELSILIENSKGNPKSLKSIAKMLHKLLVTTTLLDDRNTLYSIYLIIEDNLSNVTEKLDKYILRNLMQLAAERGYLNQSEGFIVVS